MVSVMGYFVAQAFYSFRKSGGLYGGLPEGQVPLLIEDQALDAAKAGLSAAGQYINKELDKQEDQEA